MKYLVTCNLKNGKTATVEVFATNKSDAEYRGAFKCESAYGPIYNVAKCLRT